MTADVKILLQDVFLWIRTAREAYGQLDWLPTLADVDHSALFQRIRSGKKPLPFPPGRAFSYPRYELYDEPDVEHKAVEAWVPKMPDLAGDIIIDQMRWKLVETIEPEKHYVVRSSDADPYVFDLVFKSYVAQVFLKSTGTMGTQDRECWFFIMRKPAPN